MGESVCGRKREREREKEGREGEREREREEVTSKGRDRVTRVWVYQFSKKLCWVSYIYIVFNCIGPF